jgi:hypothetical protein
MLTRKPSKLSKSPSIPHQQVEANQAQPKRANAVVAVLDFSNAEPNNFRFSTVLADLAAIATRTG